MKEGTQGISLPWTSVDNKPNKVKKKVGGTRMYGTDDGGRGYDGEA